MLIESPDIKIFAGSSGAAFAKKMCKYLGTELGASEVIHFSDGNVFTIGVYSTQIHGNVSSLSALRIHMSPQT